MNIYTDLAAESNLTQKHIDGVTQKTRSLKYGITKTKTVVSTQQASQALNKQIGTYITIEAENFADFSLDATLYLAQTVSAALNTLIDKQITKPNPTTLCVGIGNPNMTPDSLGPRVNQKLIITRHIDRAVAERLEVRLSQMCAISPSVLGMTGIETYDIIKGVVDTVKPSLVIVTDSLAAKSPARIGSTFQLSDAGIVPGGALSGGRRGLDKDSLGVPVIAIGVPFVVHARVLGTSIVEEFCSTSGAVCNGAEDIDVAVRRIVSQKLGDLVVTPKDIDSLINDCAFVISVAINASVHRKLSIADVVDYIH